MKVRLLLLFAVLLLVVAPLARGDESIALRVTYDSWPGITVVDGGFGDTAAAPGIVAWSGVVDGWRFSLEGIMNAAGDPEGSLHLNSLDGTWTMNWPLIVEFSRWGIDAPLTHSYGMEFAGTINNGSIVYQAYRDVAQFGQGQFIGALGPFGPQVFADVLNSHIGASPGPPYSLTQRITITPGWKGTTTSFDATLKPVPEPGTGILLGLGALAIGTLLRRRFA
jgi:hypothetical protein